ncbi:MAG TPA: glycine betaine ABC transporter substrate-binding protein [Alphaproteobacteria bacterium]|nr:glycine betaine ABC transporter substrate-binding protein [Alphaproteobacteria bacterium]
MGKYFCSGVCASVLLSMIGGTAFASEKDECKTPRFVDIGWSDIRITTEIATTILEGIGYSPKISLLTTDVAYAAMSAKKVDIFLGAWMPAIAESSQPYRDNKTIEKVRINLTGAVETIAVPSYVYDAGIKSLADLVKHKDQFQSTMYGIDPGSNKPQEILIAKDVDGLGDWKLLETSEAAMLAAVDRSIKKNEWIAFHAWAPHPMNLRYKINYLTGGEKFIGENFGASTVQTDVRSGYLQECPNIGKLLQNLEFDVDSETKMMTDLVDKAEEPRTIVLAWLRQNPEWVKRSLNDVVSFEGRPAYPVFNSYLSTK